MAKRFTDTELWDKEWFMSLSCKHKLLIKYLFDKCDVAGIWQPNWPLASTYIGQKVSAADLNVFKKHIDILPDGKIFVVDFIGFQYGELSENCAPHKKIINLLKKYNLYERVLQGYCKGTATLMDMEEEEDKEEEKEKEKESAPVLKMLSHPFSQNFVFVWGQWVNFKKNQHKFIYKTTETEQIALNELIRLSKSEEKTAIDIIMQSIANGWKGFFPLKNENNGSHQQTSRRSSNQQNAASFYEKSLAEYQQFVAARAESA